MDDKYLSIDHEPALSGEGPQLDPSERRAALTGRPPDEIEALRDSVASEPALPQHLDPGRWKRWWDERRRQCSPAGNLTVTVLAAVLSGPFAVVGALFTGRPTISGYVYDVIFAPVIEELLKQSGMTYLLEKQPYRLFAAWQFVFAAMISGLAFGAFENLVWVNHYAPTAGAKDVSVMAAFRWTVCTPHVGCAIIASLGLIRVWRRQLDDGRPADLSAAFPWFAAAMVVHGLYNLGAVFVEF